MSVTFGTTKRLTEVLGDLARQFIVDSVELREPGCCSFGELIVECPEGWIGESRITVGGRGCCIDEFGHAVEDA